MARRGSTTRQVESTRLDEGVEHLDADSLNTEELNSTVYHLGADATFSDIQTKIDEVTTENGGGGGTVELERNAAYVAQSASDELWLKSNVVLDLDGATLKLADGLNDSAPENALVNFDNSSLTVNAHVRNGEVDGNLSNNSSFTGRAHRHGVSIHYVRIENGSAVSGTRPKRCTIENIHAHDTIASNVNVSGENCTARNLWLENSGNDHWLYMPSPIDCHVENVWCSGFARSEGIVIGSFNDGEDYYGNTLEKVRVRNVSHTPTLGPNLEWIISVRDANTGTGTARNNTLRDVVIEVNDTAESSKIRLHAPTTVDDVRWRGAMATDQGGIVNVAPGASGSDFENLKITLTAGDGDGAAIPFIRDDGASNIAYRGLSFINEAAQNARAFFITGVNGASENAIISDYHIDGINNAFRIAGENMGVSELAIGDGTAIVGSNVYDLSGSPTFADGTMAPCDVTTITNTYPGRTQYNDGTVGTEGPCHYTSGGSWVSDVDGTTIA